MALNALVGSPLVGGSSLLHTPCSPSVAYPKQRLCRTVVRSSRLPLNPREAKEMAEGREPERRNEGGGGGPNPFRFFQNFKDNLFADHKKLQREKNLPKGDLLYTVEKGDTLYSISERHACSLELLMEANGIEDPHVLQVGQEIWIPRTYQIKKGDTLYSISKQYGVSIEAIQKANGIDDPNFIHEGDHICLPEGTVAKDSSASINDMVMED
jgi:LysM repeat protein